VQLKQPGDRQEVIPKRREVSCGKLKALARQQKLLAVQKEALREQQKLLTM